MTTMTMGRAASTRRKSKEEDELIIKEELPDL
jgi:hypothetical protein